ncbi:hypothetical protein J7W19_04380 [Streptomyces mobaraensis NBRC 13819 = DSM 40847]|nr:hypothetical protein J7W19_04380 [Streptomyces mobaraensis NBRC 13819 = DSM 40847]
MCRRGGESFRRGPWREEVRDGAAVGFGGALVVRVGGGRDLEAVHRAGAQAGVTPAGGQLVDGRGLRQLAERAAHLAGGDRAQHHPGPGVGEHRLGEQPFALQLLAEGDRHIGGPAVPERDLEQFLRVGAALTGGEGAERRGAVDDDPQRAADVLGGRTALLPRRVGGHQPPLGLLRGPLQGGRRARRRGLHGQYALPAGEARVLARPAPVDDHHVPVVQGLQQHRAEQRGDAARGPAEGQQVGFGRPLAGAPDDRRHVARAVPVGHRQRPLDGLRVGEAQQDLAGGGHEALRADADGEGGQHGQVEDALLLVPDEAVLPAPARLGLQQVLDAGAGLALPVGEVRRVAQPQGDQPALVVEGVVVERLPPDAAVGVERRRVERRGEVRDEGLVQGLESALHRILTGRRGGGAVPAAPRAGGQQRGGGQRGPVGDEGDDEHAGGGQQQRGAAPVPGGAGPAAPAGRRQRAQAAADGDDRVQHVAGAVGDAVGELPAGGERGSVGQGAGDSAPAHGGLLTSGRGGTRGWTGAARGGTDRHRARPAVRTAARPAARRGWRRPP